MCRSCCRGGGGVDTVTPLALDPARETVAPARKPIAVIVTRVPPFAVYWVDRGHGWRRIYGNVSIASKSRTALASGFVTVTLTAPAACAEVVAVTELLLTNVTPV